MKWQILLFGGIIMVLLAFNISAWSTTLTTEPYIKSEKLQEDKNYTITLDKTILTIEKDKDSKNPDSTTWYINDVKVVSDLNLSSSKNADLSSVCDFTIPKGKTESPKCKIQIGDNSDISQYWNSTLATLYSVGIFDYNQDGRENDVIAGGIGKVYAFDEDGTNIWNFTFGHPVTSLVYDIEVFNRGTGFNDTIAIIDKDGAANGSLIILDKDGNKLCNTIDLGITYAAAIGDFNEDGNKSEIVVGAGNTVYAYYSNCTQIWNFITLSLLTLDIETGDLDNDNYYDDTAILAGFVDVTYVQVVNGSGNSIWNTTDIGGDSYSIQVGDIDKITGDDIIVDVGGGQVNAYNGSGFNLWNFTNPTGIPFEIRFGNFSNNGIIAFVDDGLDYLFVLNSSGKQSWNASLNMSDGYSLAVGDLDNDNLDDIVLCANATKGCDRVMIFNNSGSNLWNYTVGNDIGSVYADGALEVIKNFPNGKHSGDDVVVGDLSGNLYVLNMTGLGVDTDYPIIYLTSPANDSNQSTSVTFTYNVSDITSSIKNCTLILNSTINQTDTTITESTAQTFSQTLPINTDWLWNINCTDNSTNSNTNSSGIWLVHIRLDTTPPTFSNPKNSSPAFFSKNATMNITATDDVSLSVCRYSWNISGTMQNFSNTTINAITSSLTQNRNITLAKNNDIRWQVWCNDSSGNQNISSVYIMSVSNTAPVIDSYTPTDTTPSYERNTNITFTHTSSDIDGDSINYNWFVNGTLNATTQNLSLVLGGERDYNITLTINDSIEKVSQQWIATITPEELFVRFWDYLERNKIGISSLGNLYLYEMLNCDADTEKLETDSTGKLVCGTNPEAVNYANDSIWRTYNSTGGEISGTLSNIDVKDNISKSYCGNITGAASNLCTLTDTHNTTSQVFNAVDNNTFYKIGIHTVGNTTQQFFNAADNGTFQYINKTTGTNWLQKSVNWIFDEIYNYFTNSTFYEKGIDKLLTNTSDFILSNGSISNNISAKYFIGDGSKLTGISVWTGYKIIYNTSATDSADKNQSATCDNGLFVLSCGASVNTDVADVTLGAVYPINNKTCVANAKETDGIAGTWTLTATAICADVDG